VRCVQKPRGAKSQLRCFSELRAFDTLQDVVGCADSGVIGTKMTSFGVRIFKIKRQKMESIFAPGKLVACRSSLQAALVGEALCY